MADQEDQLPFISVMIPLYNEERYAAACVESLLQQDYPRERMEAFFVDGRSEDRTRLIIQEYAEQYPFIKLLDNPERTVPYALNIAITQAKGIYIIRLDAHCEYATDYISQCVRVLEDTGADNVGGPMIAKGRTRVQSVIAASYTSPFSLGGGKFHDAGYEGYVDTVYLGAYRKNIFGKAGLFDKDMIRNQDDEMNYRILKSGGKIYLSPSIRSVYFPRSTFRSLASQYFQYGKWKALIIRKHGRPATLRQFVPLLFVLFLVAGGIAAVLSPFIAIAYGSVLGLYLLLNAYFSFTNRLITGIGNLLLLMWTNIVLHTAYGAGFWAGFVICAFKPAIK